MNNTTGSDSNIKNQKQINQFTPNINALNKMQNILKKPLMNVNQT